MTEPNPLPEPHTEILLVGDEDDSVESIMKILAPSAQPVSFRRVRDPHNLHESLSTDAEQIVISNGRMDGCDVLTALEVCTAAPHPVPFIAVSEDTEEAAASALIRAGASDCIFKDRLYRLRWAVKREIDHLRHRRKELQAAANSHSLETRMTGLLDIAPDAFVCADINHRIIAFNKSAERIFGYSAGEILGCSLDQLIPDRFRRSHRSDVMAFAKSGNVAKEMSGRKGIVGRRKDGAVFHAEASISVLKEDSGPIFVAIVRDVTEKKRAAQRMEYLATHDDLTGLPNRALFMDRLSHALVLAEREEKLVALFFIDLDGFKQVNDRLGHGAGDTLLCAVAKRRRDSVRRSDTVGRLGGDEFAVILERMERVDDVSAVARTIISKLCNPFDITGTEVSISASIGITLCPFDAKNVKELMIDADRAMYVAKASGKNRFEFYSEEFSDLDTRGPSGPRW